MRAVQPALTRVRIRAHAPARRRSYKPEASSTASAAITSSPRGVSTRIRNGRSPRRGWPGISRLVMRARPMAVTVWPVRMRPASRGAVANGSSTRSAISVPVSSASAAGAADPSRARARVETFMANGLKSRVAP